MSASDTERSDDTEPAPLPPSAGGEAEPSDIEEEFATAPDVGV